MSNTRKPKAVDTENPEAAEQTAKAEARQAEANGHKTATVRFRGFDFTIPLEYDEFSVDLIESLEEGKTVGIIRGALGPRQWAHVQMRLRIKDLTPLMEEITRAMGFTAVGESQASSD
jgi:hypothetical protein